MFAKVKESLGWSYFQARFHAYIEMSWYFGVFCVFSLASAIWASVITDKTALERAAIKEPLVADECSWINTFLKIFALTSIGEMTVCFLLTIGLPSIMRSANWGLFGLISLGLLVLTYLAKFAALVIGVVWVWGSSHTMCSADQFTSGLYVQATKFLIGMISVYTFQLLFGTGFLVCCGLEDAVGEGYHWFNNKYGTKNGEDASLLPDSDEEAEEAE